MTEIAAALLRIIVAVYCIFCPPTLSFDASEPVGDVSTRATGFLYGMSEEGVPSSDMTDSLDISSVSAKTQGGLQHPVGDIDGIAGQLTENGTTDYMVVYLQDMYPTWYYDEAAINAAKAAGEYDPEEYIRTVFFPLVEQTVTDMKDSGFSDRLVYCLYNECDNGVWFGEWMPTEDGGWNSYNETGRSNFYKAWKLTFDYVRELDPGAVIGGPGFFEYDTDKLTDFLSFASENGCMPDVIIYHELLDRSVYDWKAHAAELRGILASLGEDEDTPVIVTEYGRMQDNGDPCMAARYISVIEESGVWAQQAYWLLANNLSNTCADYNTPNSAWWVYRKYADMRGSLMKCSIIDAAHSDFGKAVKEKRELRYERFLGTGAVSEDGGRIDIIASGSDYRGNVRIKGLCATALFGQRVRVTVEKVTYQGIGGAVTSPELVRIYTVLCPGSLTVSLGDPDPAAAFFVRVEKAESCEKPFVNDNLYKRYEFENGRLAGDAYTYDSAYVTTGDAAGMVGGMEKEGDGVSLDIRVPCSGEYELTFIYGKDSDGLPADGRKDASVGFYLDGGYSVLRLANTVRSENTSKYTLTAKLSAGKHEIAFRHIDGTFVLDSLLVRRAEESRVYTENDADAPDRFICVAPEDGYYVLTLLPGEEFEYSGQVYRAPESGRVDIYLKRGVNFIVTGGSAPVFEGADDASAAEIPAADMTAADGAFTAEADGVTYIDGISSDGGSASFTAEAPEDGVYLLRLTYATGRENGVHAYNIDLVEDRVLLTVNGEEQKTLYTRNTMSFCAYTTVVTQLRLSEGENVIELSAGAGDLFNGNTAFAPRIAYAAVISPVRLR